MSGKKNDSRDPLEVAAERFLKSRFANVCFEPNGVSTFPDFVADDAILFEVTRLVTKAPLEEDAFGVDEKIIPLAQKIESGLKRFQLPDDLGRNLFVEVEIGTTFDKHAVQSSLKNFREVFARIGWQHIKEYWDTEFLIRWRVFSGAVPSEMDECPKISLGSLDTEYSSGFVVPEIIAQVQDALERKRSRLKEYNGAFSEAWLAVGLGVSRGLSDTQIAELVSALAGEDDWTGIVLLKLFDSKKSVEIRLN